MNFFAFNSSVHLSFFLLPLWISVLNASIADASVFLEVRLTQGYWQRIRSNSIRAKINEKTYSSFWSFRSGSDSMRYEGRSLTLDKILLSEVFVTPNGDCNSEVLLALWIYTKWPTSVLFFFFSFFSNFILKPNFRKGSKKRHFSKNPFYKIHLFHKNSWPIFFSVFFLQAYSRDHLSHCGRLWIFLKKILSLFLSDFWENKNFEFEIVYPNYNWRLLLYCKSKYEIHCHMIQNKSCTQIFVQSILKGIECIHVFQGQSAKKKWETMKESC